MSIRALAVLFRQAARDQEIAGFHIQKDQWIGCAVYAMHRDPKYWQVGINGSLFHVCGASMTSLPHFTDCPAAVCLGHLTHAGEHRQWLRQAACPCISDSPECGDRAPLVWMPCCSGSMSLGHGSRVSDVL